MYAMAVKKHSRFIVERFEAGKWTTMKLMACNTLYVVGDIREYLMKQWDRRL
jgi:hypothetical protein